MCIKARDGMVQSLARRGESERRFEEDDQLEDEDYEVIMIRRGNGDFIYVYIISLNS